MKPRPVLAIATACRRADEGRGDVALVFIDDTGWRDLSSFANQELETRHPERLAREGLRFEQLNVDSPIGSPTRGEGLGPRVLPLPGLCSP